MPISWGDAKPLLEQLGGLVAPEEWRGALPITYHVGPGPATVHLKLDFDWTNKPLYDVIATMPGSVFKDQWILYGNHHDAWVNGASDPASGAAALMETARTLSTAAQARLAAQADHRLRALGRRRIRPDRLDGMGRKASSRNCRAKPRFTSTPIPTAPAPSTSPVRTRWKLSCAK